MSEVSNLGPGLQILMKNPPPIIPAAMATMLYIPVTFNTRLKKKEDEKTKFKDDVHCR